MKNMSRVLCLMLCLFVFTSFTSTANLFVHPSLSFYVGRIQQLPAGEELISKILAEGRLRVIPSIDSVTRQFNASWERETRTIRINCLESRRDEICGDIVFEMQNALTTSEFQKLDNQVLKGQINKKDYVRASEYLEFVNSINAAKVINSGMQNNLFPKESFLPTYNTFEEYLYYQKISGHSDVIAENFDIIRSNW